MSPSDRYKTSHLTEDQYEPGSNGTVLKNLQGIKTRDEIEVFETGYLWAAEKELFGQVREDQTFTAEDICAMHRSWLKDLSLGRGVSTSQHKQGKFHLCDGPCYSGDDAGFRKCATIEIHALSFQGSCGYLDGFGGGSC